MTGREKWDTEKIFRGLRWQGVKKKKTWIWGRKDNGVEKEFSVSDLNDSSQWALISRGLVWRTLRDL